MPGLDRLRMPNRSKAKQKAKPEPRGPAMRVMSWRCLDRKLAIPKGSKYHHSPCIKPNGMI